MFLWFQFFRLLSDIYNINNVSCFLICYLFPCTSWPISLADFLNLKPVKIIVRQHENLKVLSQLLEPLTSGRHLHCRWSDPDLVQSTWTLATYSSTAPCQVFLIDHYTLLQEICHKGRRPRVSGIPTSYRHVFHRVRIYGKARRTTVARSCCRRYRFRTFGTGRRTACTALSPSNSPTERRRIWPATYTSSRRASCRISRFFESPTTSTRWDTDIA